jgi:hypothetical protein
MATVKQKSEGKSMFLKEYLMENPSAGGEAVAAAWREAGNEGTISESLIAKIRRELGLTGKGATKSKAESRVSPEDRGRTLAKKNTETEGEGMERPAAPQVAGGERTGVLIRLEGTIDELLHEMKLAGGLPEFEVTLRQARRILARSHVE